MIAAFLALALAADTASPVTLSWSKPLGKDLAALPRIAAPLSPQTVKINAALARGDARARAAATDCRASAKESINKEAGDWGRSVTAPFRYGPWLSIVASDDWFCGGAYPDTDTLPLTYDLEAGAPLDWRKLLPAAFTGKASTDTAGDGTVVGRLASPAITALYKRRVLGGMDADGRKDCASWFDEDELPVVLWLDADQQAVVIQTTAFPHAGRACAEEVNLSPADLAKIGAAPRLIALLKAAHAARAWTDSANPR